MIVLRLVGTAFFLTQMVVLIHLAPSGGVGFETVFMSAVIGAAIWIR